MFKVFLKLPPKNVDKHSTRNKFAPTFHSCRKPSVRFLFASLNDFVRSNIRTAWCAKAFQSFIEGAGIQCVPFIQCIFYIETKQTSIPLNSTLKNKLYLQHFIGKHVAKMKCPKLSKSISCLRLCVCVDSEFNCVSVCTRLKWNKCYLEWHILPRCNNLYARLHHIAAHLNPWTRNQLEFKTFGCQIGLCLGNLLLYLFGGFGTIIKCEYTIQHCKHGIQLQCKT